MAGTKGAISALALVAGLMAATAAAAFPLRMPEPQLPDGARAGFGARVMAPVASHVFCRQHPGQCAVRRGGMPTDASGAVVYSDRALRQLRQVQASVNAAMSFVDDVDALGSPDLWRVGVSAGDCEDFALEKRRRLIAAGWPSSAVLLAIGRDRMGRQHAILVARTTRGDFALDNQLDDVAPLGRAGFWMSQIQSPARPDVWVAGGVSAGFYASASSD